MYQKEQLITLAYRGDGSAFNTYGKMFHRDLLKYINIS
jgi:hypothetical protein